MLSLFNDQIIRIFDRRAQRTLKNAGIIRNLPTLQIKHIIGRMSDRQIHTAIETHRKYFKERLEALRESEQMRMPARR